MKNNDEAVLYEMINDNADEDSGEYTQYDEA
jgi:hypothetical protein